MVLVKMSARYHIFQKLWIFINLYNWIALTSIYRKYQCCLLKWDGQASFKMKKPWIRDALFGIEWSPLNIPFQFSGINVICINRDDPFSNPFQNHCKAKTWNISHNWKWVFTQPPWSISAKEVTHIVEDKWYHMFYECSMRIQRHRQSES